MTRKWPPRIFQPRLIDKLQVLDKKSDMAQMTGFDDGEEETVINLTVKPGMKQGWFGNAYGGYGSKDRYEATPWSIVS